MALGAPAVAPSGYAQFCARQPTECGASGAEIEEMRVAAERSSTAVAAITYDWSRVFGDARTQRAAAPPSEQTGGNGLASYNWSSVFANAEAPRPAASVVLVDDRPQPLAASTDGKVQLTQKTWSVLTRTNDTVNRALTERSDQEIYGVSEYWATPLQAGLKGGDCEDYVLEKRRALLQAGLPAHALSIAVVGTSRGETHAVLLVATDRGEYVLDNLSAWVLPWQKTAYQWRERQVDGSASQWAWVSGARAPTAAPANGLLLASLR